MYSIECHAYKEWDSEEQNDVSYFPPNAQGLPPVVAEIYKIFINADAEYAK